MTIKITDVLIQNLLYSFEITIVNKILAILGVGLIL